MKETLIKFIEHYGEDYQINKSIEAISILTTELSRKQNEEGLRIDLIQSLANAWIMIEQLKLIFGPDLIENLAFQKVERLNANVEEDRQSHVSGAI